MLRSTMLACVSLFASAAIPHATEAQCPATTTLVDAFRFTRPIADNDQQNPSSGWTFERSRTNGTGREMLVGVTNPSWVGGAWGSPGQPLSVPLAGPNYDTNPPDNGNPYFRRAPSFDGIMLHPNAGSQTCRAVFTPQRPTSLATLSVSAELLGSRSPNTLLVTRLERASGGSVTLIAQASINSLAPAVTLAPAPGVLPIALEPGDRIVIESANGGNAEEDWLNVDAAVGLDGPPQISIQPIVRANCDGPTTVRVHAIAANTYRWLRDGMPITDGPGPAGSTLLGTGTPTLTILNFGRADVGLYACSVQNICGTTATANVTVALCFVDFNCDGFLDFFDYDEYVIAFETGDPRADFNGDGFLDFFDYDDFVAAFEVGC
jgi:hypothetical protein